VVTYRQRFVQRKRAFHSAVIVIVRAHRWRRGLAALVACVLLPAPSAARAGEDATREAALVRFAQGVYLLEQGQAADAIAPLEYAWRASVHDPHVGARLAQAYYAVRDIAKAERLADEVLAAAPERADLLHMKARFSLARGDVAGAIGFLERARSVTPPSIETERMLASLYAESGDFARAIACLERCLRLDPGMPGVRVSYGELLLDAGEPARAEAAFREALALDPLEPRAVENLYDLCLSQGRRDEAVALLETYASQPDAPWSAVLKLAQVDADAGRFDEAARVLEEGRATRPPNDEADLLLGRVYFEAGRYEEARAIFEPMYRKAGNSPELARILGDLSLKTGDAAAARGYFERAISWRPDDYRSYLALFFAGSQRFAKDAARIDLTADESAGLLEKASQLAPRDDHEAQFSVGMAFSSVERLEEARVHLARANEIKPQQQPVLFNLASVYEKMGRYADAERVLVELHALAPDDPAVCNFYGYLLAVMDKDLERAEELVRRALAREPDNAYYIDSLGWVFFQRGDYALAVTELERAVRIVGEDAVILEHLGDAYSALSRYRDALTAYQQSSRLQESNAKLREKIQSTQRRLQ
jgi:tetratricopeptide (TPR) repeat protein